MSDFRFDVRRESFAKAQNRFADCFIGHTVPHNLQSRFPIRYVLWFWFQLTKTSLITILFARKYIFQVDVNQ